MDIRKLQRAIVDGLEDVKAQDILVFNTEHLSPLFERVIIATGSSNRQTKALASGVRESVKAAGFPVLATEGGDNGEWIIVDCGAAVAHVMQPAIREYYRLEEIWGGKPVKMKLGATKTGLVKASEPDDDDEPAMAPERKAAARKGVAAKQGPGACRQGAEGGGGGQEGTGQEGPGAQDRRPAGGAHHQCRARGGGGHRHRRPGGRAGCGREGCAQVARASDGSGQIGGCQDRCRQGRCQQDRRWQDGGAGRSQGQDHRGQAGGAQDRGCWQDGGRPHTGAPGRTGQESRRAQDPGAARLTAGTAQTDAPAAGIGGPAPAGLGRSGL